jgi:hypothetical protein
MLPSSNLWLSDVVQSQKIWASASHACSNPIVNLILVPPVTAVPIAPDSEEDSASRAGLAGPES